MLSKKMEKGLNAQIQREFYSAYMYLSMSAYSDEINFTGFAHWMRLQSAEERGHALRLFDYVKNRGGRVVLEAVERPPSQFKSARHMFEQALKNEQDITKEIHKLYKLAKEETDYATEVELQWFIQEQVEEENTAGDIVEKLKMVGDQPAALLMLDRQLAARQPVGP